MSPKQYLESLVRGAENLRFAGRDSKGKPIFFEAPVLQSAGGKPTQQRDAGTSVPVVPASGVLVGLGVAGCMLFCSTAGQSLYWLQASLQLPELFNIGGALSSSGIVRSSDNSKSDEEIKVDEMPSEEVDVPGWDDIDVPRDPLKSDPDFARWFHKEYKNDQRMSGGKGTRNPDMDIDAAYRQWVLEGRPKVK
jgi:hypothetical protein